MSLFLFIYFLSTKILSKLVFKTIVLKYSFIFVDKLLEN